MRLTLKGLGVVAMASATIFCSAISSGYADDDIPDLLKQIEEKTVKNIASDVKNLRPEAIREAARTLAVQTAVKWRYEKINAELERISGDLDAIFNFRPLLLQQGRVLPPVIVEGRKGMKVESDVMASSSEVVYRIVQEARFVQNGVPTWRSYLSKTFSVVEDVNPALMPKTPEERDIWKEAAHNGWDIGVKQAERVFQTNLNRLVRDYRGVLKFEMLAAQNIVNVPMLAVGRLGIQVQGKILDVDQKVFRITKQSTFNRVKKWKPIISIRTNL